MQITLDCHTARFFDDTFHRGEAKQKFHLQGLDDRISGGRDAKLFSGARTVIETLFGDARAELAYSVEFYRADEEQRCVEVLGCASKVRRLAQKKCEVEILQAMIKGGELEVCTFVRCTPWVNEPLKVETKTIEWQTMAMPLRLRERCANVCSQLGTTPPLTTPPTDGSPESLRQKVRYDWAARFFFEVEGGSAHEIMVHLGSLIDEIEALKAEIAAAAAAVAAAVAAAAAAAAADT